PRARRSSPSSGRARATPRRASPRSRAKEHALWTAAYASRRLPGAELLVRGSEPSQLLAALVERIGRSRIVACGERAHAVVDRRKRSEQETADDDEDHAGDDDHAEEAGEDLPDEGARCECLVLGKTCGEGDDADLLVGVVVERHELDPPRDPS